MESQKNISIVHFYRALLEKYRFFLFHAKGIEEQERIMNEVYQLMKDLASKMYDEKKGMSNYYRSIVQYVPTLEDNLFSYSLFPVVSNQEKKETYPISSALSSENVLFSIVQAVREILLTKLNEKSGKNEKSLDSIDLAGYCPFAAESVEQFLKAFSIKYKSILLEPGFIKDSPLFENKKKHRCTLVQFHDELYLVDVSYSQFFWIKNNLIQRLGVPLLYGCSVGVYMTMTEERKRVAATLLRDGFVKVTPEVLKHYLDGFALSYRNGLAYLKEDNPSYTTSYTANDYLRFLYGTDNQMCYEDELTLGIQKRPLSY